jgi:predicted dehydrogenase
MIKQARHLVATGELGTIRKIVVEYPQGWLAERIEASGQKQASWRTDPSRSGPAGALGDIGTHAEHLVRYVTGLEMEELFADMAAMVSGRALDDDSNILIHYAGGARGILYASQVSQGEENALSLRVYGTKAGLEWKQEHPNHLTVRANDAPIRVYSRGHGPLCEAAAHATRLPSGHPEGYPDAFANIYANAIRVMTARLSGTAADPLDHDFPSPEDGARGIHFINCALESATTRSWVNARYSGPTMAS